VLQRVSEQDLSTPAAALKPEPQPAVQPISKRLDISMLAGIGIAIAAMVAGITATGVRISYFLQPTGVLIVLGGTLGVTFITTPSQALRNSARAVRKLFWESRVDRLALIDQIMALARPARTRGILALEPMIASASPAFLRDALTLAIDLPNRDQLRAALETKLRLRERQGEADAKTLEVAGGFAPTIGVLGTVVGLIEVLRQFSNVAGVASGVGTAFVSTIYGLGLANVLLLPAAHRIRARVAEAFETDEMIVEGVLAVLDGLHPTLMRERLNAFLESAH
jgi:chemotaxis protein MotA